VRLAVRQGQALLVQVARQLSSVAGSSASAASSSSLWWWSWSSRSLAYGSHRYD
jgi:hypothetical protein